MAISQICVKKAYCDTPQGQLHYRYSRPASDAPKKSLPILLLHMSASSSKCFTTMMAQLSGLGYTCFAPDMPGFGGSFDPASDPPNIEWYAGLYHGSFSAFQEFEGGCHLIGHHSGAVIGTELANCEGFARTLTLVGPTVMTADERAEMRKSFLAPFNRPVPSGAHLLATWEYVEAEGIPRDAELDLLQRETLDHIRAWKGRSQIYSCVWQYDAGARLASVPEESCKVLALCAPDDVLWPFFHEVGTVGRSVSTGEIKGANFGPDLDSEGIVKAFLALDT